MIQIFDNLFTSEIEDKIEELALSQHYEDVDNLSYLKETNPQINLPLLFQEVAPGDKIKGELQPYLRKILRLTKENSNISFGNAKRWKINKLSPIEDPSIDKWGVHVDQLEPHYSIIYYVNDTNGDTIFYDNTLGDDYSKWTEILGINKDLSIFSEIKRVPPKKGRIVIFDGKIFHRSSYPTSKDRYIINFNVEYSNKSTSLI